MAKFKFQAFCLTFMLAAFALDLLSKSWANSALEPGLRQVFIPQLLNFILVSNTGLAFSMANHNELLARFLASIVFLGLIYFYYQKYFRQNTGASFLEGIGFAIVIGAAAGNLFERFAYGHVTDFIEFAFINFPVFNIADVLIDTGIGLILISIYFSKKQIPQTQQTQKELR